MILLAPRSESSAPHVYPLTFSFSRARNPAGPREPVESRPSSVARRIGELAQHIFRLKNGKLRT